MIFVYRTSVVVPSGMPLSDYAEGDLVKLNEGGNPVEFYVAKHDYESGLNGAGRTLVVRKDCYDLRAWDADNNAYASSDIDAWFNGTYKNLLDANVQEAVGTTKFYYTIGNNSASVSTLERSIFALSGTELGKSNSGLNTEGSVLPIASTLQIAYLNETAAFQWTRSPYKSGTVSVFALNQSGSLGEVIYYSNCGARPCFTLPSSLLFNPDTNEVAS